MLLFCVLIAKICAGSFAVGAISANFAQGILIMPG